MTELATEFDVQAGNRTAAPAALITEREVLMGSAAALAAPKLRPAEKPRRRRHYPQRHEFLERALMSRMMERL